VGSIGQGVNSLTAITSVGISPYLQWSDGGVDGAIGHSLDVRGRLLGGVGLNMLNCGGCVAWSGLAGAGCCVVCVAGGSLGGGVAGVVACAANRANQSMKR